MRDAWQDNRALWLVHHGAQVRTLRGVLGALSVAGAVVCVVALILLVGFDHTPASRRAVYGVLKGVQASFVLSILFGIVFGAGAGTRMGIVQSIMNLVVLLSVWPLIYTHAPAWSGYVGRVLFSHKFLCVVLGSYSLIELSYATMLLMGRRTNPTLLLAGAFLFFILAGSLILMMPRCHCVPLNFTDSFFVATSAVSITGLTTVDVAQVFTPLGQGVICLLLQIGGIGIITFTSFFAIFYSGRQSIYTQLLVKDIVYSKSMRTLVPTLMYIMGITFTIEALGAVAVYFTLPAEMFADQSARIFTAVFHSVSSFCNAGFCTFTDGMANPLLFNGSGSIYWVTSGLVLAGAIGFPLLANIRDYVADSLRRIYMRVHGRGKEGYLRKVHLWDLNTKIVLVVTLGLLAVCTVAFFVLESGHSMRGMSLGKRITQSVFNSLTPRSAGFVSINPGMFLPVTFLIVVVQMWIGGASQSMAGGIKVNTLGVLLLNLRSIIRGREGISAFERTIAMPSVRRANAVLTLSVCFTLAVIVALMLLEPQQGAKALAFEGVSAVFTVGSSMGITPELGVWAKYVLCVAMFVGRVGLISLLTGMMHGGRDRSEHYPTESVIIN